MKKMVISHSTRLLLKAVAPSLVGMIMLTLEKVIKNIFSHDQTFEPSVSHHELHLISQSWPISALKSIYEVAQGIERAIFASYANYSTFLLMMMLVNIALSGSDMIRYHLFGENTKAAPSYWRSFMLDQGSCTDRINEILKSFILYSLIFCFYQAIWTWIGLLSSSIPLQTILEKTDVDLSEVQRPGIEMTMPSRIMEEFSQPVIEASSSLPLSILAAPSLSPDAISLIKDYEKFLKPSLTIGKMIGQTDISAHSIKLSKDRKTAFVASSSALKILDVSDPEYPVVFSSLSLKQNSSNVIFTALTLSQDETKAFVSNIEYLYIIDIKNVKSPLLLGKFQDKASILTTKDQKIEGICKPNLLLSRDNKFLFVSGYGLQIFDISASGSPALIRSFRSRINSGFLVPASIALSDERKALYYSDGGLWIFNVEDPRNMKVLSSFNMTSDFITSMVLSDDAKTAFILLRGSKSDPKIKVAKLDLSDIYSIKEHGLISEEKNVSCQPIFLERTPNNHFLLILFLSANSVDREELLVYDTRKQNADLNQLEKKTLINNAISVYFTEDYRRGFFGNKAIRKLQIVDYYLDFPNKNAFTNSKSFIIEQNRYFKYLSFSKNQSVHYGIYDDHSDSISKFAVLKYYSRIGVLSEVSTFEIKGKILQMVISLDEKRAYWVSPTKVFIANISNPEVQPTSLLGDFLIDAANNSKVSFSLSSSGKIGCLQVGNAQGESLKLLDLSNPKKVMQKGSFVYPILNDMLLVKPILSNDDRIIFLLSNKLEIKDLSDPSSPRSLRNLSLDIEEDFGNGFFIQGILSPDGKILFVRHGDWSQAKDTLHIIDVSNVTSPEILSRFPLPFSKKQRKGTMPFSVLIDLKTVYLATSVDLMIIDITNLHSPRYVRSIEVLDSGWIVDFYLENDGRRAYVLENSGSFKVVYVWSEYSIYIMQDTLMMGERYNIDLQMLKRDVFLNYDRIDSGYKFTNFALVGPQSVENGDYKNVKPQIAPSWMAFDLKSQTLTVEPRRKSDIGKYQLYFSFSTQVQKDAFQSIYPTINFDDLMTSLLTYGFVDNQWFLTDKFDEFQYFVLPSQYSSVKGKIFQILKSYTLESFNDLNIIPSLNIIKSSNKLKISTTSLSNLNVEISLAEKELYRARFVSKHYGSLIPIIDDAKSQLSLEGPLKDINQALQQIVIDLQNATLTEGEIFVDDKLNPPIREKISNISNYFNRNQPPSWNQKRNLSLQGQIKDVYTGEEFEIKLNRATFTDSYISIENLDFQLVFIGPNGETSKLPKWISFSDMMLTGTAPEQMTKRDFEFKLVVKNEFQEFKEPLQIHVSISTGFILKSLLKYCAWVSPIITCLIYANRIQNVFCKNRYKHSKDFHVRIGQEITPEVIFPISFIREEIQEAQKILKLIKKQIAIEERRSSINERQMILSFILEGERKISKSRVLQAIDRSLNRLTEKERKDVNLYSEDMEARQLVNQIIFNTLTRYLLKEEKETRKFYSKIEKDWHKFVEWDLNNSCFKIHEQGFYEISQISQNEVSNLIDNEISSIRAEESLVQRSRVNLELLKDAILGHAFDCQNVDALPGSIHFRAKRRIKANSLERFIKWDLRDCPFNEKGKLGYGITCTRKYNTVNFGGVVESDFRSKTIIVQISNLEEKILKELFIFEQKSPQRGFEGGINHQSLIEEENL